MRTSLLAVVVVLGVACFAMVNGLCGLSCTATFTTGLVSISNKDDACRVWNTFVSCYEDDCGKMSEDTRKRMNSMLTSAGFDCSTGSTASRMSMLHVLLFLVLGLLFTVA